MIKVRKLLNARKLMFYLLAVKPDSEFLQYEGKDSITYDLVSRWCKIPQDLKRITLTEYAGNANVETVLSTHNGIIYDERKDAFVDISEEFHDNAYRISLLDVLPKEVFEVNEEGDIYVLSDVELYLEKLFTDQEWEQLEKIGAFTKLFEINQHFVQ